MGLYLGSVIGQANAEVVRIVLLVVLLVALSIGLVYVEVWWVHARIRLHIDLVLIDGRQVNVAFTTASTTNNAPNERVTS